MSVFSKASSFVQVLCVSALFLSPFIVSAKEIPFSYPKENVRVVTKPGDKVVVTLKENVTTGYSWQAAYNKDECTVEIRHNGPGAKAPECGAPGSAVVEISPASDASVAVALEYRRSWEKETPPAQKLYVLINGAKSPEEIAAQEIDSLLSQAGYFFLATADGDQPKLRPLGAHFVADGRIIFGVGDFKNVYKQLAANPRTEIVAMVDGKGKWLRYTGTAVFADEPDRVRYQKMSIERIPGLANIYNEKTGHKIMCFWLEDATAELIDMMPPGRRIL